MAAAKMWYDECLALTRPTGDRAAIANALYNSSFPLAVGREDMPRALPLLDEALNLYRELGDAAGLAKCLWAIGNLHNFLEQYDEAVGPLDEAIANFRKLGDNFGLGWAMHTRAVVALNAGDASTAEPLVAGALELFSKAGDISGITILIDDAAHVARLRGDRMRTLTLAGAASALQAASGTGLATMANVEGGRPAPDQARSEEVRAWTEGVSMSSAEAVAYALARESVA